MKVGERACRMAMRQEPHLVALTGDRRIER